MSVKTSFAINTLMCLSIGTPKTINFPFVPNGKLIVFRCLNSYAHLDSIILIGSNLQDRIKKKKKHLRVKMNKLELMYVMAETFCVRTHSVVLNSSNSLGSMNENSF